MLSFVRIVYKSRTGNEVTKYLMYLNAKFVFKIELCCVNCLRKLLKREGPKQKTSKLEAFEYLLQISSFLLSNLYYVSYGISNKIFLNR